MTGVNLHSLARTLIQKLVPEQTVQLYTMSGQTERTARGEVTALYYSPVEIKAQIQSFSSAETSFTDRVISTTTARKAYLFDTTDRASRVWAEDRELARSGDYIVDDLGIYWLVTAVLEDFTRQGWACVQLSQQTVTPTLSLVADEEDTDTDEEDADEEADDDDNG